MQLNEVNTAEMKNTLELRKLRAKVDEQALQLRNLQQQHAILSDVVKKLINTLGPRK